MKNEVKQSPIRLTERYDLSIPYITNYDTRKALQKVCEEVNIWPFRIADGKKGTVVSIIRNPSVPQYKFTEPLTSLVTRLKMELAITTIIMVRKPCKVDINKIPAEIHEIYKAEKKEYSKGELTMLKNLEEDLEGFDSHVIKQIEDADYDTREVKLANANAIKWKRFDKKCPTKQEEATYYNNGRQKTCEGQIALDLSKLMKQK